METNVTKSMFKYNSNYRAKIDNNIILTFIYYIIQNLILQYYEFADNNEI